MGLVTANTFWSYSKCRARNEKENLSEILKKTYLGTLLSYCFISGLLPSGQLGLGEGRSRPEGPLTTWRFARLARATLKRQFLAADI